LKLIEITMTKYKLFLTEVEITKLLSSNLELWQMALKRGKGITRSRQEIKRNTLRL